MAVALTAAAMDLRFRRIPNWLTLSGVLLGIGLNLLLGSSDYNWRSALMGLGLAFGVYFPLYLLRGMGAGDVKLMSAIGALVGPGNWLIIFILGNVFGFFAAILLLLSKGSFWGTLRNVGQVLYELVHFRPPYLRRAELDLNHPKAVTMPHGLAVAVGSCAFLLVAWAMSRR
jgi:prepilin peptidase CpaA